MPPPGFEGVIVYVDGVVIELAYMKSVQLACRDSVLGTHRRGPCRSTLCQRSQASNAAWSSTVGRAAASCCRHRAADFAAGRRVQAEHVVRGAQRLPQAVGFQNAAMVADQRFQAAVSYSLMSPPRIGRRRILPSTGSGTGDVERGGRNRSARCGRPVVVRDVDGKHLAQVPLTENQHPVDDLGPDGQHEAFGEAVRPRLSG